MNGLYDGWSATSILESDNPKLAVLNFPNGAHRSNIARKGQAHHSEVGTVSDTPDNVAGKKEATAILRKWLDEINSQRLG
eukprot:scaffold2438_cov167-Amphora_coffeaeformis.AAC.13